MVPRRMKGRVSAQLTISDKKVDFPLPTDDDCEVGFLLEQNDEKQPLVSPRRDLFHLA